MEKIKIEHHTLSGGAWLAAWLFTVGFLKLAFWKGVLARMLGDTIMDTMHRIPSPRARITGGNGAKILMC